MTHDLCYLLLFNYWNWHKIYSHQFSNLFFGTFAQPFHFRQWLRVCTMKTGTSYFDNLFPTCQQVLGHSCHIWYSLWLKSLTHDHSTHAGPARIHCVMTGMFNKEWKGCVIVPKHWEFFKWTSKIFENFDHWLKCITCWCVISLRWCRIMAVHKSCTFRLKWKNLLSPTPDVCSLLLALRSIQLMTGEPRPRYSTLLLLAESGACGLNLSWKESWIAN